MTTPRLCRGCKDRSRPLNPSLISDYHPACHPSGNKIKPQEQPKPRGFYEEVGNYPTKDEIAAAVTLQQHLRGKVNGKDILPPVPLDEPLPVANKRGPKPLNTTVQQLLKASAGRLETQAKSLEKRAVKIESKIQKIKIRADKILLKAQPLEELHDSLVEAARKLRAIMDVS